MLAAWAEFAAAYRYRFGAGIPEHTTREAFVLAAVGRVKPADLQAVFVWLASHLEMTPSSDAMLVRHLLVVAERRMESGD